MIIQISYVFAVVLVLTVMCSALSFAYLLLQRTRSAALPIRAGAVVLGVHLFAWLFLHSTLVWSVMETRAFQTAALVWAMGFVAATVLYLANFILTGMQVKGYPLCGQRRVRAVYGQCLTELKMGPGQCPSLRSAKRGDPACVIGYDRPYVVVNESLLEGLRPGELKTILTHELTHVTQKHQFYRILVDVVLCIHWFNPVLWLMRGEFTTACELDCDRRTMDTLGMSPGDYAGTMLKLLEHTSAQTEGKKRQSIGGMGFLQVRKRYAQLFDTPDKRSQAVGYVLMLTILLMVFFVFVVMNRLL